MSLRRRLPLPDALSADYWHPLTGYPTGRGDADRLLRRQWNDAKTWLDQLNNDPTPVMGNALVAA